MYPFVRMALSLAAARKMAPLAVDDVHVSTHTAMPWDLDMFIEVNNGRILTLYDLGRFELAARVGLIAALRKKGWAQTIAGSSVRYRHRLRAFQRFETRSQAVGRDARFFYLSQSMWRGDTALSHGLFRTAVTNADGIVPTDAVAEAMGQQDWNPELPDYVKNWIAAEDSRPWPPDHG